MAQSIFVVAMTLCTAWPAPGQFTEAERRSAVVSMTRQNHCGAQFSDRTDIRQCPSYTVSISGDGTVTYEGRAGVRTLGKRTHKISIESVRELIREFEQADFFSLRDRYEFVDLGNDQRVVIDHAIATTVSYTIAGKTKSVYDFYGTPEIVRRLEQRIDEVSDSRRYTGRPSRYV
jgi:hypothetical protein